ncbi:MAG: hypothetical protein R2861_07310 [Desulfobacterales bacterium]
MNPVKVMINGLPGNVAGNIARQILADRRFRLLPWSLTGPDIAKLTQCGGHILRTALDT